MSAEDQVSEAIASGELQPVASGLHAYTDKDGYLWLDVTGHGDMVALDEPLLRRIRDKYPRQDRKRIEAEFGPLRRLEARRDTELLVTLDLALFLNNYHHEHPDGTLTLSAAQVAELAGCADPECSDRSIFPPETLGDPI